MTYDVFLSHANADKPAVEALARRLRDNGVEPFLDIWHLVPGEPWQESLERALKKSASCAVFVGKGQGPWQNMEMRAALTKRGRDGAFRVIPVLLPGSPDVEERISSFLEQFTPVDFRTGLDDDDAYRRLVCGIRGVAPGASTPAPSSAPPYVRAKLPPRDFFVHRCELDEVRGLLTRDAGSTIGVTTALRGAGGFGKTALARALCNEPEVRQAYPDGILWTTMGEKLHDADRVDRVLDLVRWWTETEPPGFKSARDAGDYLKKVLAGKRVLLVVDDVWKAADLEPFRGLEPGTVLATTRNVRTLPTDALRVDVDAMATNEAVTLLARDLPPVDERRLAALAERLGEWPLLLRLVNSQLRKLVRDRGPEASEALRRVEERLAKAGLRAFDQRDATERSEAASLTIELSLGALSAHDRRRFLDLAVFPEDVDVPLHVLERLWELADWEAEELCGHLEDSSLLLDFTQETIRLHDVVRQYLVDEHSDLPQAHRRLLELCRPPSGRWTDLETGETFLWRHLATHLDGAGDRDEIRRLLFDLDYLESGETIRTLEGHTAGVNAVAVVDATRLVSASEDQTLRVWDLASGETAAVFALDAPVGSVAVIAGGRGIVAGDGVGGVHFLDLDQS